MSATPNTTKLLNQLLNGRKFSEDEIRERFDLSGPRQAISRIRDKGYKVDVVEVRSKGSKISKYAIVN